MSSDKTPEPQPASSATGTHWLDARLHKALAHAPDAHMLPDLQIRLNIQNKAQQSLHLQEDSRQAVQTRSQPSHPQRHADILTTSVPWYKKARSWLGKGSTPWNAAFATVLLAGVITVLWRGQVVPTAQPEREVSKTADKQVESTATGTAARVGASSAFTAASAAMPAAVAKSAASATLPTTVPAVTLAPAPLVAASSGGRAQATLPVPATVPAPVPVPMAAVPIPSTIAKSKAVGQNSELAKLEAAVSHGLPAPSSQIMTRPMDKPAEAPSAAIVSSTPANAAPPAQALKPASVGKDMAQAQASNGVASAASDVAHIKLAGLATPLVVAEQTDPIARSANRPVDIATSADIAAPAPMNSPSPPAPAVVPVPSLARSSQKNADNMINAAEWTQARITLGQGAPVTVTRGQNGAAADLVSQIRQAAQQSDIANGIAAPTLRIALYAQARLLGVLEITEHQAETVHVVWKPDVSFNAPELSGEINAQVVQMLRESTR